MTSFVLEHILAGPPTAGGDLILGSLGGVTRMPLTEVFARSSVVAEHLQSLGLGPGDTIGILAANCLEWVLLDLAALRLKIRTAGFDPGKFRLEDDLAARYDLRWLFTDKGADDPASRVSTLSSLPTGLDGQVNQIVPPMYAADDTTTIKLTSGSTGTPKGLAATVGSIDSSLSAVQQVFQHGPPDNLFIFLPLSLLQQRYWIYSALAFGHDVTLSTYQAAFLTLGQAKPTVVMGVPAFFETARRHIQGPNTASRDTESLKARARQLFGPNIRYLWTGSAPADSATLHFYREVGLPIYEGYGLNETCIVTKNHPGASREGSVGQALAGKRVVIEADGSVVVCSDFPVNDAYLHAPPGASEKIFVAPGRVRTGDLGYLDEDGFLFIKGRNDDVIVLDNGKKIDIQPIEARFREAPWVAECVIFCLEQRDLVAVLSPAGSLDEVTNVHGLRQQINARSQPDEQVCRTVVADEPFSIDNGLLTSQYKPIRRAIFERFQSRLTAKVEA